MKSIAIGLVAILTLLPTPAFCVSNAPSSTKNSAPSNNGGFNFGLAGYYVRSDGADQVSHSANNQFQSSQNSQLKYL